jgi:signal transduction histidine kinase
LPILGQLRNARISPPTRRGLLRGLISYRWLTLAWSVAVYSWEVYQRNGRGIGDDLVEHPIIGFALLAAMFALNAVLTLLYREDPDLLLKPAPILTELGLGAVLLLLDVWVYGFADHAQSLPSVWVVASVFATAIAAGKQPAVIAGFGLGLARYVGWLPFAPDGEGFYSLLRVASWVLLIVAGWTAGYILMKLEEADRSISAYRAREEVARTLHDGVLQTLAVIQRRSEDVELIDLARNQELELREYLFGAAPIETDLASGLRAAARRAEQRYGIRVDVITAPDLPTGDGLAIHAVCGAVGEALTNASKHGEAGKATVYAEPVDPDDDRMQSEPSVFVSVKDDGHGFDHDLVSEGEGLSRSIKGRIIENGGVVEIDGRPGRGAEIRMWV